MRHIRPRETELLHNRPVAELSAVCPGFSWSDLPAFYAIISRSTPPRKFQPEHQNKQAGATPLRPERHKL
jgi:hypothetical protein